MGYAIDINRFAPKCRNLDWLGQLNNSHSIAYDKCNFQCQYCELRNRPKSDFTNYSSEEFRQVVRCLLRLGNGFKFTGGEPTLNPSLLQDMSCVKELGGLVYLDSNGSRPSVIQEALTLNLVDVLGISIKGLNNHACQKITQVARANLVWDDVLDSISIACSQYSAMTIVTYVVNQNSATMETLQSLASLLDRYPQVTMKINNIMANSEAIRFGLHPAEPSALHSLVLDFVEQNPKWKGRCILITSDKAVGDYSEILFL